MFAFENVPQHKWGRPFYNTKSSEVASQPHGVREPALVLTDG